MLRTTDWWFGTGLRILRHFKSGAESEMKLRSLSCSEHLVATQRELLVELGGLHDRKEIHTVYSTGHGIGQ